MVSDTEWQWVTESVTGDWDHVVLASSLPVFLSRGIHDLGVERSSLRRRLG